MNIAFVTGCFYKMKTGKTHGFNRGMKGRALELIWNK